MQVTVIITGSTGSGKTTVALAMSRCLNRPVLNVGAALREHLRVPFTDPRDVGRQFLAEHGFAA